MQSVLKKLDSVLAFILMILMATIVIDVTWQVLSRFIVGNPSSVTEEIGTIPQTRGGNFLASHEFYLCRLGDGLRRYQSGEVAI